MLKCFLSLSLSISLSLSLSADHCALSDQNISKSPILFLLVESPQSSFSQHVERCDPASGPLRFRCRLCGKAFQDGSTANKHIENIHFPDVYTYYCKFCSESFGKRNMMYKHISRYHKSLK